MAQASARHSFHGPLVFTFGAPKLRPQADPLAVVSPPANPSSAGRVLLEGAREEAATSDERERALAGVLAALRNLTGARL